MLSAIKQENDDTNSVRLPISLTAICFPVVFISRTKGRGTKEGKDSQESRKLDVCSRT